MNLNSKWLKPATIIFLALYFVYLVASRAPAEIAAAVMHKAIPDLWLTGVQGSVWRGTAKGAQLDLKHSTLGLGELHWRLSPWSLLLLSPCMDIEANNGGQLISGKVCRGIAGTTRLSNINIEAPITPLSEYIGMPVSGFGSLQIAEARLDGSSVEKLDARLSWQEGSLNPGEGWIAVGTYAASLLENSDGGISAQVFDIDAPLKVQMVANWTPVRWQLNGAVTLGENTPEMLRNGIQLIGEESDDGSYNVALNSD